MVFHPAQRADHDELRACAKDRLRSSREPSIVVEEDSLPCGEIEDLLFRHPAVAELAAVPADRG